MPHPLPIASLSDQALPARNNAVQLSPSLGRCGADPTLLNGPHLSVCSDKAGAATAADRLASELGSFRKSGTNHDEVSCLPIRGLLRGCP